MVFVAGELLLAMAIPFVAIRGYHTLLDSRAGSFVEEPTPSEPGWRALVDSTAVVGIAEVDRGVVTGLTLLVHNAETHAAGTAILVPGTLEIDGALLRDRSPDQALAVLSQTLRLSLSRTEVLDERGWAEVLGDARYALDSPDPVQDDSGGELFGVGAVTVEHANASAFLGRPAPGAAPVSVQPRRHLFWNALIDEPPSTASALGADLRALDRSTSQVIDLPVTQLEPVAIIDGAAVESLIRDVVGFPAGSVPGDRLQVRILDRTGTVDLEDIAAAVAAQGMEVIEIGNAAEFDNGETTIIAPVSLVEQDGSLPPELGDLSLSLGTTSVTIDNETVSDLVVTVVIGSDFDLANLH